jgi:anti-sigma regulatory factor (Ser/Thr protein kinase)
MYEITLPASPSNLEVFNRFLEEHLPEPFLPVAGKMQLAVEELLMNVFNYAYGEKRAGSARIYCGMTDLDGKPYFQINVQDWGHPYNPFTEAPEPVFGTSLAERAVGGLGLFLVKKVVAHYRYFRRRDADGDMNDVELFFAPPEPAPQGGPKAKAGADGGRGRQ